jgi:alpha-L-arabinofuranosidase
MMNTYSTNHFHGREFILFYGIFFLFTGFHINLPAQRPIEIRVFEERTSDIPISQLITGNFIESGIGREVDGMWSEMIYNRTFQANITPFKLPVWGWLQMDKEYYNKNAPFWHSGYEENDWELINPVDAGLKRTQGEESFIGSNSLILGNESDGSISGIKQKGIYVEQGRTYHLSLFGGYYTGWGLKSSPSLDGYPPVDKELLQTKKVTVCFISEETKDTLFEKTLEFASTQQPFDMEFTPKDFTGRTTVEISFRWKGKVVLSWCSLMPADNMNGWRKETVEALKEIGPPIIRFPGGCFASFHRWRNSIGPRNQRTPEESCFWGDLEPNDVGIDEFLSLCGMIGSKPQITINMMTGSPFDAAELVAYCNGPDESPMGRLRKENGVQRTGKVIYWEMDNENGRKWSALQYARQLFRYAVAMREVDPGIKIMMDDYSFPYELEWLPQMLEIAGKKVDFVITRERSVEYIQRLLHVLDDYNRKNHTNIQPVNTEWLADEDVTEPFSDPNVPMHHDWNVWNKYEQALGYRQIRWFYALSSAKTILDYMSLGGAFHLANFNNCANTWGGNIIECSKEGVWKSPAGEVFKFYKNFNDKFPLKSEVKSDNKLVKILACETDTGIVVNVVNSGDRGADLILAMPAQYQSENMETLYAPNKLSRTSLNHSEIKSEKKEVKNSSEIFIKPLSVNRILFFKKKS